MGKKIYENMMIDVNAVITLSEKKKEKKMQLSKFDMLALQNATV